MPAVTVVGPGSFSLLVLPLTPGLHVGLLRAQRVNSESCPFLIHGTQKKYFQYIFLSKLRKQFYSEQC